MAVTNDQLDIAQHETQGLTVFLSHCYRCLGTPVYPWYPISFSHTILGERRKVEVYVCHPCFDSFVRPLIETGKAPKPHVASEGI